MGVVIGTLAVAAALAANYKEPVDFSVRGPAGLAPATDTNGMSGVWSDRCATAPLEDIEWVRMWSPDLSKRDLPRVLLIGDSICGNYRSGVMAALKDKAYVASVWGSACVGDPALLRQLEMMLERVAFDVIHVNNGLHGFGISDEEYASFLPDYIARIRALNPNARIVWARSTPTHDMKTGKPTKGNARVIRRNELADAVMKRIGVTEIDDLYAVASGHPELHSKDGVHFNEDGCKALAASVVASILRVLPQKKHE